MTSFYSIAHMTGEARIVTGEVSGQNLPANLKFAPTALGGASSGSELNPCMLVSQQNVGDDRVDRFGQQTAQRLRRLIVSSPRARPSSGSNFQPFKTD